MKGLTKVFPFGGGRVLCDLSDGSPVGVSHPRHPGMNFLCAEKESGWHQRPAWWGKGFVLTSAGSGRWDRPLGTKFSRQRLESRYIPVPGLSLSVKRSFGVGWSESYHFTNR